MAIMRPLLLTAGLLSLALASPARAEVLVSFVQPSRFTDANTRGDFPVRADDVALQSLQKTLQDLGSRYLPPDTRLRIEVLDVDLAGRYEPWRIEARDVRIMRDVDPPRIRLRYLLERPGQPDTAREETVTDMLYLTRPEMRFHNGDPLSVEKAVLSDWFRQRFAQT